MPRAPLELPVFARKSIAILLTVSVLHPFHAAHAQEAESKDAIIQLESNIARSVCDFQAPEEIEKYRKNNARLVSLDEKLAGAISRLDSKARAKMLELEQVVNRFRNASAGYDTNGNRLGRELSEEEKILGNLAVIAERNAIKNLFADAGIQIPDYFGSEPTSKNPRIVLGSDDSVFTLPYISWNASLLTDPHPSILKRVYVFDGRSMVNKYDLEAPIASSCDRLAELRKKNMDLLQQKSAAQVSTRSSEKSVTSRFLGLFSSTSSSAGSVSAAEPAGK